MKAIVRILFILFLAQNMMLAQCVLPTPYTENFDGTAWGVPSGNQNGTIPSSCWSRVPAANNFLWAPGPIQPPNNFTGPLTDHTSGNGKFIYTITNGFVNPAPPAVITTPQIDLSNNTNPEVSFWYHMYGNGITSLSLQVNDGSGWTNLVTKTGSIQTSNTDAWQKETVSLTSYAGDTIALRFVGVKSGFSSLSRMAVDDLNVAEAPTCAPVTNVFTTNTTANSTQVGWIAGNTSSTSWEIEYAPIGTPLGSGTVVTVTTNPYTLTNLSGSTAYAIYVREVCSPTDKSPWEGPQITTTSCSAPLNIPYSENFDGPGWVPYQNGLNQGSLASCWIKNPNSGFVYQWLTNPNTLFSNNTGPNADHTTGTGKYVAAQLNTTTTNRAIIRSPEISLSGVTNPELTFWYHMFGSGIDELEVDVQTGTNPWVTLQTISGQQQSSTSAAWLSSTLSLSAYSGQDVFIRFVARCTNGGANQAKIAIDDLSIIAGSSCPIPNALSISNITSNSAEATWASSGIGQYEVKYGAPSFDPNVTGTSVVVSASPATLSPLTTNTNYDVYIRRLCSNDTSNWIGPVSFNTLCILSAPLTEDFESADWTIPNNFPQTQGTIDQCWFRTVNNQYYWAPGPEQFPSFQTGPANDHTTGSGKFLFTQTQGFGGSGSVNANLISPQIDLSALDTAQLSFWYHMFGSQIGSLRIQINNGSGWTTLTTITGQQQTSKTAPWEEEIISLAAYANDTVQIRWRATKNANTFNTEVAIDDIEIKEQPDCPKPDDLAVSGITFNSAIVDWTTGGSNNWIIKYGAPGFVPSAGTYIGTSNNPATLTALSPNTVYEVFVRDSCGAADVSDWIGPIRFRTNCAPQNAPYTQDFEGSGFVQWNFANQPGEIDNCYRRADTNGYYWVPGPAPFTSFQTGPDNDHTTGSGKFLYTRTNTFGGGSALSSSFVTPWIDISQLATPELRFWYHMYGLNIDDLEILVRSYSGTPQLLTTISGQQQTSGAAAWLQKVESLSAYVGDTVQIIFRGFVDGNGFRGEIAIDDIEISNPQVCNAPTNLTVTSTSFTTADLTWTSGASAASSNVEYGPPGFSPGSGTKIFNVSSPYTVTGLMPNTAYDFYVQDSCTWSALSTWDGPATDTTLICPNVSAAFAFTVNGLTVDFDASATTGSPNNYGWDFDDGNLGTGITTTHTYANGGTYNVTLLAVNACGELDTLTQQVVLCGAVSGTFITQANNLSVSFDASASTGLGLQYDWLFGDGNSGTGMTTNHTYGIDGAYTVSLILTDTCGFVDTVQQNITVCDSLNPTIVINQNGLTVDYTVTGANAPTNTYNWNYGDGNTGSGLNVSHTYATTGTFIVSVNITNICGQTAFVDTIIDFCNPPKASWTYSIISSNATGMEVQFDGTQSIGASSFLWEFGDGSTNNVTAIPVHKYSTAGLFWVVKLTVFNDCGDQDFLQSSLASIGIEDLEKAGLISFPNPVDDELVLELPAFVELINLEFYSSSGQLIQIPSSTQGSTVRFNTSNIAQGAYILRVETDAGEVTFNIIVQH